jgi:hypothetical protein
MNLQSELHKISIGQIYQRNGSDCVLDPFRKKSSDKRLPSILSMRVVFPGG